MQINDKSMCTKIITEVLLLYIHKATTHVNILIGLRIVNC